MGLISVRTLCVDTRLAEVSFDLRAGEVLGLVGPNGAGKSTLLHALAGIQEARGEVLIDGIAAREFSRHQRARTIGLQPQAVASVWSLSVEDVVALGRMPWGDENKTAIAQAMTAAGIEAFAKRNINELSGGERARVWLARVIAGQPRVLLADEPISSLDIHYQLEVMNFLKAYARKDNGVIVALHDLSLAARYCDRLCLLKEGRLVALGEPFEVLTETVLEKTYGVPVKVDLAHEPPVVLPR